MGFSQSRSQIGSFYSEPNTLLRRSNEQRDRYIETV
jgi:hypothetical protein